MTWLLTLTFLFFSYLDPLVAQEQALSDEDIDRIQRIMQIHYVKAEHRSPVDKIELSSGELVLSVWKELPEKPERENIECRGYRWLLGGRGKRMGEGVHAIFEEFHQIQRVRLELLEIEFDVESVDGQGELRRTQKPQIYLRMAIERNAFENLSVDRDKLKRELHQDLKRCLRIGRGLSISKEINL